MHHLTDSDVESFVRGALAPADQRRVVRHLVTGCAACGRRVSSAFPTEASPLPEGDYDGCIDRALQKARRVTRRWKEDQERLVRGLTWSQEKKGLLSELTPAQARSILPWIRVEILIELSFEVRYRDPGRMLDLAKHAQEEADRIEETPYGPAFLFDLRSRAWAELANACRVNELFDQAELALWQARNILEQSTDSPLLQARLADVEASLRKDQRRFPEAQALLKEAHRIYLRLGERHLAGRALVKKGMSLDLAGNYRGAAKALQQSIELLDAERDSKLVASAQNSLLLALVNAGRLGEAGRLLFESGLRETFAEDPQSLLRLRWTEGKLLARRGRISDAARVFSEVRSGFRSHGLEYVAAVAGTDEAAMLLRMGQRKEAHLLALDLWRTFQQRGIHAEAERALRFLEVACRGRVATPVLAERVGRFLDQAQRDRTLRFEPAALVGG